jgi:sarcosine oxidase subunit delta
MLMLTCPVCGLQADETEFQPGGEAHQTRPASTAPDDVSDEAQRDYLYQRDNRRGIAHELWLCARGCGKWFHASRDTFTLEFKAFYRLSDPKPEIVATAPRASARKAGGG